MLHCTSHLFSIAGTWENQEEEIDGEGKGSGGGKGGGRKGGEEIEGYGVGRMRIQLFQGFYYCLHYAQGTLHITCVIIIQEQSG